MIIDGMPITDFCQLMSPRWKEDADLAEKIFSAVKVIFFRVLHYLFSSDHQWVDDLSLTQRAVSHLMRQKYSRDWHANEQERQELTTLLSRLSKRVGLEAVMTLGISNTEGDVNNENLHKRLQFLFPLSKVVLTKTQKNELIEDLTYTKQAFDIDQITSLISSLDLTDEQFCSWVAWQDRRYPEFFSLLDRFPHMSPELRWKLLRGLKDHAPRSIFTRFHADQFPAVPEHERSQFARRLVEAGFGENLPEEERLKGDDIPQFLEKFKLPSSAHLYLALTFFTKMQRSALGQFLTQLPLFQLPSARCLQYFTTVLRENHSFDVLRDHWKSFQFSSEETADFLKELAKKNDYMTSYRKFFKEAIPIRQEIIDLMDSPSTPPGQKMSPEAIEEFKKEMGPIQTK